jgi:hypothetical protein
MVLAKECRGNKGDLKYLFLMFILYISFRIMGIIAVKHVKDKDAFSE